MTAATDASAASTLAPSRFYGIVAIAEAVTWTLLIAVMVLRYGFEIEGWFTFAGGLAHGFVFVTYGASVIVTGLNQRWRVRLMLLGIVTAIVPYATVPFDRWLERRGLLDGDWRTERTDDPRDATWVDGALRWFLRHPILLGGVLAASIVAVVGVLLMLGPPTQWGS